VSCTASARAQAARTQTPHRTHAAARTQTPHARKHRTHARKPHARKRKHTQRKPLPRNARQAPAPQRPASSQALKLCKLPQAPDNELNQTKSCFITYKQLAQRDDAFPVHPTQTPIWHYRLGLLNSLTEGASPRKSMAPTKLRLRECTFGVVVTE